MFTQTSHSEIVPLAFGQSDASYIRPSSASETARHGQIQRQKQIQLSNTRGQSNFEVTLALNFSVDSSTSLKLSDAEHHLLGELLVKAGVSSYCDILHAHRIGRSREVKENFAQITDKFNRRALTLEQAVVAINHIHLTGASVDEAMQLVGKTLLKSESCFSLLDFLKETGILAEETIRKLDLGTEVEPGVICKNLLIADVINANTLRNAVRLRYLLNKGELSLEQATQAMHLSYINQTDVEQCFELYANRHLMKA